MKLVNIKDTDLKISSLIFGTVNAGLSWDGPKGFRMLDQFIDAGGNCVDTASVYSNWAGSELNRAERFIGDWLYHRGRREQVILITKGGHPNLNTMNISRMSKQEMEKDLNNSLSKMRTDYIDIYFYHRDDLLIPVSELIEQMESFVKDGKIRYYACSNWTTSRMQEAQKYAELHGYRGFVASQNLYNIASSYMKSLADSTMVTVNNAMLRFYKNSNIVLMPYMALCNGFFSKLKQNIDLSQSPYYTPQILELSKKIDTLCKKYNATISQILLGYCLSSDIPMCPLFSISDEKQLNDILNSVNIAFDARDFDNI